MIIRNRSRGVVDYGYFMRKPIQKLFTAFAVAAALLQSYLIAEAHASFGFPVIPEEKEKSGQDSELFSDNDSICALEKSPSAKKGGYTLMQLERKGFRFFYPHKEKSKVDGEHGSALIEAFKGAESSSDPYAFAPEKLERSIYFSGVKTDDGNLDGLVLLKASGTKLSRKDGYFLGYVCNGNMALPLLSIFGSVGDDMSIGIDEGGVSYLAKHTAWKEDSYWPLFEEMKKVYGNRIADFRFVEEVISGEILMEPLQEAFDSFMSGPDSISSEGWHDSEPYVRGRAGATATTHPNKGNGEMVIETDIPGVAVTLENILRHDVTTGDLRLWFHNQSGDEITLSDLKNIVRIDYPVRKDLSLDWRVHLNDSYYWPEDKDEAIITIKPGEKTPVKLLLFSLDSKATTDSVKVANFMKITTQAPAVKVDEIKWELSKIDGSGYKGIPYGTVTLKNLLIPRYEKIQRKAIRSEGKGKDPGNDDGSGKGKGTGPGEDTELEKAVNTRKPTDEQWRLLVEAALRKQCPSYTTIGKGLTYTNEPQGDIYDQFRFTGLVLSMAEYQILSRLGVNIEFLENYRDIAKLPWKS